MLTVLVHPHGALSPGPFRPLIQLLPRLLLSFLFYLLASSLPTATAQDAGNRQLYRGLSTLAAPSPNAVLNAGGTLSVAIDVSAATRGDSDWTLSSLEVYIVSTINNVNLTVSSAGSGLVMQEPGSTVKHIDWQVATCLATGNYNLTIYEASTFSNGTGYFAITPVPVQVRNDRTGVDFVCTSRVNALQAQPQPDNPPPQELIQGRVQSSSTPSFPSSDASATATPPPSTITSSSPQATGGGNIITVTAGDGDITIPLSDLPGTIVVEPSGGAPPELSGSGTASPGFITIFRTVTPTATFTTVVSQPVTITIEETSVSTFIGPEETREVTVTQTLISTIQLLASGVSSPEQAGLLPVNAATPFLAVSMLWTLSISAFCYVLCFAL